MSFRLVRTSVLLLFFLFAACSEEQPVVLPDPEVVEGWFQGEAEVEFDEQRLVIDATMDPTHLARGGRLWQRATPYFYLFNVHVRQVLLDYPSIEGVDVIVRDDDGEPLARVSLDRSSLNSYQWDQGLAYTSRAQREGTERPIYVAELLDWADEHVDEVYTPD